MSRTVPTHAVPTASLALNPADDWLLTVKAKSDGLRYGVIQIVFHDARVVQIERTERIRLDRPVGRGGDDA